MTILILLFSSMVFGAKLAGLGAYKAVRTARDDAERTFMTVFDVKIDPSASEPNEPYVAAVMRSRSSLSALTCMTSLLWSITFKMHQF